MLIKEMRKTIPEGMFSSSAMDTFTEMMDQALPQPAENGSFGFAEAMLRDVNGKADSSIKDGFEAGLREIRTSVAPLLKDVHQHQVTPHGRTMTRGFTTGSGKIDV